MMHDARRVMNGVNFDIPFEYYLVCIENGE